MQACCRHFIPHLFYTGMGTFLWIREGSGDDGFQDTRGKSENLFVHIQYGIWFTKSGDTGGDVRVGKDTGALCNKQNDY